MAVHGLYISCTSQSFSEYSIFFSEIYVRKSREKSFWKKNLEIKTLEKSPNFIKSFEKMSLEIKSCVLDSLDFFPNIVWGLPIKSQEIRSQEKKVLKKINQRKIKT